MWLRHGKPKECSHFLRLANKKEKNVNEGTKISKVSFFLRAALKCSTSNTFSYNQNIASLLQLHRLTKENTERRKKCFLGCLKYYRNVSLERCQSLFQFQGSSWTTPSKPLSHRLPCLWGTVVENKPAATCAVAAPQLTAYLAAFFVFLDSTSGYKHPVPLRPESKGWGKLMGISRSWSLVIPINVREI